MPNYRNRNAVLLRAVSAIRALQTCRPTLPQLAAAMSCSERTARRYLETLQLAHVPVRRSGAHYRIEGRL